MTIKECIDIVDNIKPNQYTVKEKVGWLSFIDEIIINDVLKTHEGYDGRYDDFEGYSEDKLSTKLIVPSPYDRLYTAYLKMKIDGENGEMARYNNSAELFNSYMMEYRKYYNKTHMPLDVTKKDSRPKPGKGAVTLPDAVIENIKRDLYAMLSEDVAGQISDDKINAIVTSYMLNNAAMLKGKDGDTPKKGIDYVDGVDGIGIERIQTVESRDDDGANVLRIYMTDGSSYRLSVKNGSKGDKPVVGVDYFTEVDKQEFKTYIDEQTEIIKSDVEGLQAQINEEAHFRGYLTTNAKIKALSATPNDFAYSAESGTKWVYDANEGWQDTGTPVPDQLTPASDTTPLINGIASVGSESAYARGDHRHPTDTTRASIEALNKVSADKEDVSNKIQSTDEMTGDGTQYMSADLTLQLIINAEQTGANMGINHADMRFGEASDRMDGLEGDISGKEDKTNKVTEITEESTDEQYPSAKAVVDFAGTSLVLSGTLEEDVQQFTLDLGGQFKELYLRFYVPTIESNPSENSRIFLYDQNGTVNGNIWYEQSPIFGDGGLGYTVVFHIKTFGNYNYIHRYWNYRNYTSAYNYNIDNCSYVPGVLTNNDYISSITALMYPLTTRYFPVGSTYEIWGVKA